MTHAVSKAATKKCAFVCVCVCVCVCGGGGGASSPAPGSGAHKAPNIGTYSPVDMLSLHIRPTPIYRSMLDRSRPIGPRPKLLRILWGQGNSQGYHDVYSRTMYPFSDCFDIWKAELCRNQGRRQVLEWGGGRSGGESQRGRPIPFC